MALNYANASSKQMGSFELIPHGTLAWAVIEVRPFNIDQGLVVTPSKKNNGNAYLDIELTVVEPGPHAGQKVWDMIGVAGSDKYVQGGQACIRHIVEVGKRADETTNPGGYILGANRPDGDEGAYLELNGLKCAIEVGVEEGATKSDGGRFPDKNRVLCYLTPNAKSQTPGAHEKFKRLLAGDTKPREGAPTSIKQRGGSTAASAAAPAAAPGGAAPGAKPAWLQNAQAPQAQPPQQQQMAAQVGGNSSGAAPW